MTANPQQYIKSIRKKPITPIARQQLQKRCIELIFQFKTIEEIWQYWRDLGYSENRIGNEISQCYTIIRKKSETEWPYIRDNHLHMYKNIISKCEKMGDIKNIIKCLENIENLAGIGKDTDNKQDTTIKIVIEDLTNNKNTGTIIDITPVTPIPTLSLPATSSCL
jgi:hypothetical protein